MSEPIPWLSYAEKYRVIDPHLENAILAALGEGATLRQAAQAAGLSFKELQAIRQWGERGMHPWQSFYREMEQARYEASRPATRRRHSIGSAENASLAETTAILKVLQPDDYAPEQNPAAAQGQTGIQINIMKSFPSPALPDPSIVEGELVEGDE